MTSKQYLEAAGSAPWNRPGSLSGDAVMVLVTRLDLAQQRTLGLWHKCCNAICVQVRMHPRLDSC